MDFILHGTTTPRHQRESSAKTRKPAAAKTSSESSVHVTPEAPRQAGRPPSGRPQSRNQVTNKPNQSYTAAHVAHSNQRPHRPDSVPRLNLTKLVDSDNTLQKPIKDQSEHLYTPDTSSTVSWGTPVPRCSPFALHHTPKAGGAKSHSKQLDSTRNVNNKGKVKMNDQVVPENLPPPSAKQKQQYQQYQDEMKQQYQAKSIHKEQEKNEQQKIEGKDETFKQQEGIQEKKNDQATDDYDILNTSWGKAYSKQQEQRKLEAEDSVEAKKKQDIVEQVMVDQLSRAVISDPSQNSQDGMASGRATPYGESTRRGRNRSLHESKVCTDSSSKENLLAKRLSFTLRLPSRNGHDALRELFGFYFMLDDTMTIYEYRQFGKNRTSALPFIQRGSYSHVIGRRKGRKYSVRDLMVGGNLSFETSSQSSLPEVIRKQNVVTLRITDVEMEMKETFIFGGGRMPYDKDEYNSNMKPEVLLQEIEDWKILHGIQSQIKSKLKRCGCRTLTGLGRHFKQLDQSGDGVLNKDELIGALKVFHIDVEPKLLNALWLIMDQNGDGAVDHMEFTRAIVGEMSEFRKALVRKAFQKVDANKSGTVGMDELKMFFRAQKHPLVQQGKMSADEVMDSFLDLFNRKTKEITWGEFEDYYEGTSIGIENDEDFVNMMKNCWGI
ncbi:calcyphosin-2-like [Anneissia japonica]|uniref:calcyphosin-2-like n=1 Tax=Anneissia japonica TaxID=1529436 RepID=UPI0014258409|nr:calcyphosin-2-like [Anneissia japonica]XP_033114655.1 calcyphosin-2-like [Anneissia japonica]XP_033114663.1 calcyphosin-2-like [Anneissia japonica]XP_033114672.1 calcyphosin-2-like [Anneissia japonica]XP_033114683.1 calcyphosin-2-like [Anneissia japonica]